MKKIFFFIQWIGIVLLGMSICKASTQEQMRQELANLTQDYHAMRQEWGQLILEIEDLRRDNEALKREISQLKESQHELRGDFQKMALVWDQGWKNVYREMESGSKKQKHEIIQEVTRQINNLASEIQHTIDLLAKAPKHSGKEKGIASFSDDYPKEGIAYTVQAGDNLSSIAKRYNSTVKDIQNANHIADPRELRSGQTIFIPQKVQ